MRVVFRLRSDVTISRFFILLLFSTLALSIGDMVFAHQGPEAEHIDPEMLNYWRIQIHLVIQWIHLVTFALWVGGLTIVILLRYRLRLDFILFATWALLFVLLGTGSYNMLHSAGIPEPPEIFNLSYLSKYRFGASYVMVMGFKHALFLIVLLLTVYVTFEYLRRPSLERQQALSKLLLRLSWGLALAIVVTTSSILTLHEAADLVPTPLHSLGGVARPRTSEWPDEQRLDMNEVPKIYTTDLNDPLTGLRLLSLPPVTRDIVIRSFHLLGFAIWLAGSAASIVLDQEFHRRLIRFLLVIIVLQFLTGIYQMQFLSPFDQAPYMFRLEEMIHYRFGKTYAELMALKHALALAAALLTVIQVKRIFPQGRSSVRWASIATMVILLAIAYVTMAVALIHEGVDHVL